jgi:sugar-specific transcriptional regulator TrmB
MVQPKRSARAPRFTAKDANTLDALRRVGLTDYEARVYLGILRHPGSRIPEIASATGVPQPKVYGTIRRLIERGLCETELGPVNTYSATPPKSSFLPLLEEMRGAHESARELVKELQKEHVAPSDALAAREGRIKLFQGKPAAARNFRFLLSRAQREVALLLRVPGIASDADEALAQAVARGAEVRVLIETGDDDAAAASDALGERWAELGCDVRRIDHAPLRLAVFDRRYVLLPMREAGEEREGSTMLEVRNEGLAEGLLEVLDAAWAKARPVDGRRRR